MNLVPSRPTTWPAVGVAIACLGFVLGRPLGIPLAVALAVTVVLPWPLPFAFGQVAAAVAFETPGASIPFALVQGGLWLGLGLSAGTSTHTDDRHPLAVTLAAVLAVGLFALLGTWTAASRIEHATVVAAVIAVVLYGVHRYEQVTVGLVEP